MLPQADDNYGTDSCSLLVTKTQPPMIVIGTKSSGKVHHCVALSTEQCDSAIDKASAAMTAGGGGLSNKVCLFLASTNGCDLIYTLILG